MRDQAHLVRPKGKARNAHLAESLDHFVGSGSRQGENDDVGVHGIDMGDVRMTVQGVFEHGGVGMVVGQTRHMMVKSVQSCSRQHTGLTHAAPHDFPRAMGFGNERI